MDPDFDYYRPSLGSIPGAVEKGFFPRPQDQWEMETQEKIERDHMIRLKSRAESYKRSRIANSRDESIISEASIKSLQWSPGPYLLKSWFAVTAEIRFLAEQEGRLLHPQWPFLSEVYREEKNWKAFLAGPEVWMIHHSTMHSPRLPQPLLVRSTVPPVPGDQLFLQSLFTWMTMGEQTAHSDVVVIVVSPVLYVPPQDFANVGLGAVVDQALFEVLPESIMALSEPAV